jgi:hypothetical protein
MEGWKEGGEMRGGWLTPILYAAERCIGMVFGVIDMSHWAVLEDAILQRLSESIVYSRWQPLALMANELDSVALHCVIKSSL